MSNPRVAPEARITADGKPLPAALRASISRIALQQGLEGADRLELTVATDGTRWLEHPQLALDRELRLELGYTPDPLEPVFVGDVVGLTPSFPAEGTATLQIVAHDRRRRLQRGSKTRWFAIAIPCVGTLPIPDPVVAGHVAAENELRVASDPVSLAIAAALGGVEYGIRAASGEGEHELVRKQKNQNDLEFLKRIAEENGWLMTMDHAGDHGGNVLRFTSFFSQVVPDLVFRYGENLIEFSPRLTTVGEILRVTARFWVPQLKVEMTVTAGWDWDRQALEVSATPSSGMPRVIDPAKGAASRSETSTMLLDEEVSAKTASRAMLAKLIGKLNQRLTGTASIVGDTRVRPGRVVQIEGVGRLFGGSYRVTGVTHSFGAGGFLTSFDVRKEVWFDGAHLMRGTEGVRNAVTPNGASSLLSN